MSLEEIDLKSFSVEDVGETEVASAPLEVVIIVDVDGDGPIQHLT